MNQNLLILTAIISEIPRPYYQFGLTESDLQRALLKAAKKIAEDLEAHLERDPAAKDASGIDNVRTGFIATSFYRFNRELLKLNEDGSLPGVELLAEILSQIAKARTGIDIHPSAKIGDRFVIDHGQGTVVGPDVTIGSDVYILNSVVIGETAEIGDDVFMSGGVTLGAKTIAGNPNGKRHPTIGDRVQIGAHVRIYGPITVGDDVFIGPGAIIKDDIPAGTIRFSTDTHHVINVKGQDNHPDCRKHRFEGLVGDDDPTSNQFHIHGQGLDFANPAILDLHGSPLHPDLKWSVALTSCPHLAIELHHVPADLNLDLACAWLRFPCGQQIIISKSAALRRTLQKLKKK